MLFLLKTAAWVQTVISGLSGKSNQTLHVISVPVLTVEHHSLLTETVSGCLSCSPYRWCLRLQNRLLRRLSSPPPPPRLSPPHLLHRSGLLRHHGYTHTSPPVSSASLTKETLTVNTGIIGYWTDVLFQCYHFALCVSLISIPRKHSCISFLPSDKSYLCRSDVASQSSPAFPAGSRSWSWSVTAPFWLFGAGLSSLWAKMIEVKRH